MTGVYLDQKIGYGIEYQQIEVAHIWYFQTSSASYTRATAICGTFLQQSFQHLLMSDYL